MSTQKTDTQQSFFDPGAMKQYQGLTGAFGNTAQGYMQNPFSNPFFQTQQQMGTRQAQNLGGTAMSDLLRNMTTSGMAGGASSPAGLQLQQDQSRANTGLQSQLGFLNPVQNALQQQNFYSQLASQFRPLQTGGKQTEATSGLGTWLPQLASAGLGAFGSAMTGGLSSLFGGGGGGFNYGGANSGPTSFMPQGPGSAFPGDPFSGIGGLGGMAGAMPGGYQFGGGMGSMMPPPPMAGGGGGTGW